MHIRPILGLLSILVFSACSLDRITEREVQFSGAGWSDEEVLQSTFTIEDTTRLYNLVLELDHAIDYPNQNLYTMISTGFPDGKTLKKEVSLELASKAGKWYGSCGSEQCRIRIPIQSGAFFNMPGKYTVKIAPFMRENPVKKVSSIKFWV